MMHPSSALSIQIYFGCPSVSPLYLPAYVSEERLHVAETAFDFDKGESGRIANSLQPTADVIRPSGTFTRPFATAWCVLMLIMVTRMRQDWWSVGDSLECWRFMSN